MPEPIVAPPPETPPATPPKSEAPAPLLSPTPAPAVEWKEFVADTTKSADENAAAKAAHDATKPAAKVEEPAYVPLAAEAIKFPEGVKVDDALLGEFLGLANEHKLPAPVAQAIVDLQLKSVQTARESDSKTWNDEQVRRQEEVRKDPVVGGAAMDTTIRTANTILSQYGSPELTEEIAASGLGNSVRFFHFLAKVAPRLLEAAPIPAGGTPGATGQKTAAELIFPNQGKPK